MEAEPSAELLPHRGPKIVGFAAASLATQVSGWCCFAGMLVGVPLGIVAWVLANEDLRGMDAGTIDPSGRQQVKTGKVLAIVSLVVGALYVLLIGSLFVAGFVSAALEDSQ